MSPPRLSKSYYSSQASAAVYTPLRFDEPNQYSRPVQDPNGFRVPVSVSPSTNMPYDRHHGGCNQSAPAVRHSSTTGRTGGALPQHRPTHQTNLDAPILGSRLRAHTRAPKPPQAMRTRSATAEKIGLTVRLSNLPSTISKSTLYGLLNRHGSVQITSCRPHAGEGGLLVAYAVFDYPADAQAAVARLNGAACGGSLLTVTIAKERASLSVANSRTGVLPRKPVATVIPQVTKGPLVVDGAKSSRTRYKGRHSPADSDLSDEDSDASSRDSDDDDNDSASSASGKALRPLPSRLSSLQAGRR